jgi:hypothetical protein
MATVTPNYNWPVPQSTDFVKDGADSIKDLGDAIDATVFGLPSGALTLISTTTIGTAVASVTVSSVFSATYDSYKVLITGWAGSSSAANTNLKFDNSAGSTYCTGGIAANINAGTTLNVVANNSSDGITFGLVGLTSSLITCDIVNPFLAVPTHVTYSSSANSGATSKFTIFGGGFDTNAASQTGFSFNPSGGTLTGGTVYVYGYQK